MYRESLEEYCPCSHSDKEGLTRVGTTPFFGQRVTTDAGRMMFFTTYSPIFPPISWPTRVETDNGSRPPISEVSACLLEVRSVGAERTKFAHFEFFAFWPKAVSRAVADLPTTPAVALPHVIWNCRQSSSLQSLAISRPCIRPAAKLWAIVLATISASSVVSPLRGSSEQTIWRARVAQKLGRIPRIGYLAPARLPQLLEALHDGLRELGYIEGQNIVFDYRFAEGQAKTLDELATELVGLGPDVIVTVASGAALAMKRATSKVPIVMATVGEPVGIGLVSSLARPGGNITGVTLYGSELARKRLELLKEAVPGVRRIALLGNLANPFSAFSWNEVQPAGPPLGLELRLFTITDLGEFPATFAAIDQSRSDALFVLSDALFNAARREIVRLAAQHRLPSMFEAREFVEAGGLLAYGPNIAEMTRRSASLIVKIIKGVDPGDLPIEQPTMFELSVNVQTGKTLGITIPASVLLRADTVIE